MSGGGIGKLRHVIALQEVTNTVDAGGGQGRTWATTAIVWAEVKPASGREQLHAMQLQDSVTHRITIRYCSDVKPTSKWRILFDGRHFNIRSVLNVDERNKFLVIMADEGVGT